MQNAYIKKIHFLKSGPIWVKMIFLESSDQGLRFDILYNILKKSTSTTTSEVIGDYWAVENSVEGSKMFKICVYNKF